MSEEPMFDMPKNKANSYIPYLHRKIGTCGRGCH